MSARRGRALILARGAGRRMQAADPAGALDDRQLAAAARGDKAFMPIDGRPFVDFAIDALRSAGIEDICLVVGPERALAGAFAVAVQTEPRGTADAVLAAQDWAGDEPFIVLNGDNLYPVAAIAAVASADGPALAGFDRDDLVATSNIPADRIAAFAVVESGPAGCLSRIIEKPTAAELAALPRPIQVSMNLWRFDSSIFAACRDVSPSSRGEWELPSAVMLARERGTSFAVVPTRGPVLDLSRRSDVAAVSQRLGGLR